MTNRTRNKSPKIHSNQSEDVGSAEMSFDVVEWLESERLEHEKRMQEHGYFLQSREELSEHSEKQHRKKTCAKI